METLINELRKLEQNEKVMKADIIECEVITSLANDLLIDDEGKIIWDNIRFLEANGYYVFPLEQDGFGWLVAGISTLKGVITYG